MVARRPDGPVAPLMEALEQRLLLTTAASAISYLALERSYGADGGASPGYGYGFLVTGDDLTAVRLTTPWGEVFSTAGYLPTGWTGQTVAKQQGAIRFEAFTDAEGQRHVDVHWVDLSAPQQSALDSGRTTALVSFKGGSWTGTVGFGGLMPPAEMPSLTYPAADQVDVPLLPTLQWSAWGAPPAGGFIVLSLVNADTQETFYQRDLSTGETEWRVPALLPPTTSCDATVEFIEASSAVVNGLSVNLLAVTESTSRFTTAAGGIGHLSVERFIRSEGGDASLGYGVGVSGFALTRLNLTTPWDESFTSDDFLPQGWAGESVDVEQGLIDFEASTDADGQRHLRVTWNGLAQADWDALDTDQTSASVDYVDGTWSGALDFTGVTQPAEMPNITYPAADQEGVPLQPTIQWDAWDEAPWGGQVIVSLEKAAGGGSVYEDALPASAAGWAPPELLDIKTLYSATVQFADLTSVTVSGFDVAVVAATQQLVQFTTVPYYSTILTPGTGTSTLTFTDADLDRVTVTLGGKVGSAEIRRAVLESGEPGDMTGLVLDGTDATSTFSITVKAAKGWTTVGDVEVYGALKSLAGAKMDLLGDLTATGPVGQITLRDVRMDEGELAGPHLLAIGPSASAKDTLTLVVGNVRDLSLDSKIPVKSIRATFWVNADGVADSITAPWLGTLTVNGDFGADVILDGDGVPAGGKTLTSATVKGSVAPSVWDVTGTIGAITINGDVGAAGSPWVLSGATSLATLTLGDVVDAAVTVSSGIGSVKAKRWQGGAIGAAKIASITTTGAVGTKTTLPIPGDFAAGVTLTDATAKLSLGRMTIAGGVLGATISSAGPLGTFTLGAIRDSTIQAGDMDDNRTSIASLTVRGVKGQTYAFVNSNVSAYALGRISVRGVDPVSPGHVTFGITGHTMTSYSRDGKATPKIQPGIVDQLDHYVVQLS